MRKSSVGVFVVFLLMLFLFGCASNLTGQARNIKPASELGPSESGPIGIGLCGNGVCTGSETCRNCPGDCGPCEQACSFDSDCNTSTQVCLNGQCKNTSCTDTDNGVNFNVFGAVSRYIEGTIDPTLYHDTCDTNTALTEYFCMPNNDVNSIRINCQYTCTSGACNAPPAFCGNGIIDANEMCDVNNLAGQTCTTIDGNFTGGTLSCNQICTFDASQCTGSLCGNGICNADENSTSCLQDCPRTQIVLKDQQGYPFNPDNHFPFDWQVSFFCGPYPDNVCLITIANFLEEWKDGTGVFLNQTNPPLYVPAQALTSAGQTGKDSAGFLYDINSSSPGQNFYNIQHYGFEEISTTSVFIGEESHTISYVSSDNRIHQIPFYIELNKDVLNSSFIFDNRIIFYASTSTDYGVWDGNATFSMAPIPSSTFSDFLVIASDGRRTMYWTEGNVTSDPLFINLHGQDDQIYRYRIYGSPIDSNLYLILDSNNSFSGQFDADIHFRGTDINEDGATDFPYYWLNQPNFGGGIQGNYYIANFELETGGSFAQAAEPIPDFDTKIFIDTMTGKLIFFPNTDLSFYNSSVKFNPERVDGGVFFDMDNDPLTITKFPATYNDWGSRFDVTNNNGFIAEIPDVPRKDRLKISLQDNSSIILATGTNTSAGTMRDFNSFQVSLPDGDPRHNPEFIFNLGRQHLSGLIDDNMSILLDNVSYPRVFRERIVGEVDVHFDYLAQRNIADLEAKIHHIWMFYVIDLGEGIPRNYQDGGAEDEILIPFFGRYWRVVSLAPDTDGLLKLTLEST